MLARRVHRLVVHAAHVVTLGLALAASPARLAAQAPRATGPAMPTGRRSLHLDATLGHQRLRMNECVGCPEGREYATGAVAISIAATTHVVVGVNRIVSVCWLCGLRENDLEPAVRIRTRRAFVRWWPRHLGPVFVQATAGRTRYRFEDWPDLSFRDGRLVSLRGTELGAGVGMSVPLFGTAVGMTPFVDVWRVPRAHGTRRTQAGNDVRHATTLRGWQAGLALTLRVP